MAESAADGLTLGRRVRHYRRVKGLTQEALAQSVGTTASSVSLVESGRREPKLALVQSLAAALGVEIADLLAAEPPSRRAALEIQLERAQSGASYELLGLPRVRTGPTLSTPTLEALVGLHEELALRDREQVATPEEARRANAELRRSMRDRNNYYTDIEAEAERLLDAVGHREGPLSQLLITAIATHLGFTLHHVADLPHSTRSVSDLRNRRIYLPQQPTGTHDPRTIVLQTLGHFVLGHVEPTSYGDFLRQRVEVNYFAAALLVPQRPAVEMLQRAKAERQVSIDDLRDAFGVSYETAAHRFTNLATHHLSLPVHFMRVHENGIIYKAYENDGVVFPSDHVGSIEGQPVCRKWTVRTVFDRPVVDPYFQYTDTPSGTYWCTAQEEHTSAGRFAVSVGVPYAHVKWFRGRETELRSSSTCPDPRCCRRPSETLTRRWAGEAWPSARAHSHLLAALPPGTFPGVDDVEVYEFLESQTDGS